MVDYHFYCENYLGASIPVADFPLFSRRAEDQLANYKRVYTVKAPGEDSEAMAVCAIADAMYAITLAQNGTAAVSSAAIGSVSVSYAAPANLDLSSKGRAREIYRAAQAYLDIYRG
jgi:hypothetical protein